MRGLTALAVALLLGSACAKSRRPAVPLAPDVSERLTKAGLLMRTGCYDCLEDALAGYESLRTVPNVSAGSSATS